MDHFGLGTPQSYQQQQQQPNPMVMNSQPSGRDQVDIFREILENVLESYRQIGIVVQDVQPTSQTVINEKLCESQAFFDPLVVYRLID